MSTSREQVVDSGAVRRVRTALGDAGLDALARLFVEQTPGLMNQLREAVVRQDATSAKRMAHSLKGSSITLGAVGLASMCRELEENDVFDGELLEGLDDMFETTREQLFAQLSRARRF